MKEIYTKEQILDWKKSNKNKVSVFLSEQT